MDPKCSYMRFFAICQMMVLTQVSKTLFIDVLHRKVVITNLAYSNRTTLCRDGREDKGAYAIQDTINVMRLMDKIYWPKNLR